MSDERTSQSNPKAAEYDGVSVDNPTIRDYARNMARQGTKPEEAAKRLGMPKEVVDRIYKEVKEEK